MVAPQRRRSSFDHAVPPVLVVVARRHSSVVPKTARTHVVGAAVMTVLLGARAGRRRGGALRRARLGGLSGAATMKHDSVICHAQWHHSCGHAASRKLKKKMLRQSFTCHARDSRLRAEAAVHIESKFSPQCFNQAHFLSALMPCSYHSLWLIQNESLDFMMLASTAPPKNTCEHALGDPRRGT
jgi:hypothetical protein